MSSLAYRIIIILGALSLAWMFAPPAPSVQATAERFWSGELSLEPRTAQAGPISIKVSSQPSGTNLVFSVTLDTHSIDLDSYDLSQLATVRTDQGLELQPERWEAPKGGHHREGILAFSLIGADGIELIGPQTGTLELVIREIGGVPESVIQWTLAA